jgi:hypothetical protein
VSQPQQTGSFKPDTIRVRFITIISFSQNSHLCYQDVAESLGITNLSETVISALASDVEYRIHQVVEVRCVLILCLAV